MILPALATAPRASKMGARRAERSGTYGDEGRLGGPSEMEAQRLSEGPVQGGGGV